MPEHREGTPEELRDLESFLWWDFDDQETWRRWVEARGGTGDVAAETYATALHVQVALRAFAAANNGVPVATKAVRVLNHAIVEAGILPRVTAAGDLQLGTAMQTNPVNKVLASALAAMSSGTWRRFKICQDVVCRASYYDASRNSSKTWCSMNTCGSRNKMRRHRRLQTSKS